MEFAQDPPQQQAAGFNASSFFDGADSMPESRESETLEKGMSRINQMLER
jgi:hypothetical protein